MVKQEAETKIIEVKKTTIDYSHELPSVSSKMQQFKFQ